MGRYLSSIRQSRLKSLPAGKQLDFSLLLLYIIQLTHSYQSELHQFKDKRIPLGSNDSITVLPSCFWEMTRLLSAITFTTETQRTDLQFLILLFLISLCFGRRNGTMFPSKRVWRKCNIGYLIDIKQYTVSLQNELISIICACMSLKTN